MSKDTQIQRRKAKLAKAALCGLTVKRKRK